MSYVVHPVNESPIITGEAGAALIAPAMKVLAFDANGKFVLPTTGTPVGVALATKENAAAGDRMDVQITGICYALAGETIKRGQNLKAHTDGTVKVASAGDSCIGIALGGAASGKPVEMLIVHISLPASGSVSVSMADLSDVDLSTPATNGQVLKYDSTASKWKPGNDTTA